MIEVLIENDDIVIKANQVRFYLTPEEAKIFTKKSSILRGAWRNSQDVELYDKCLTINKNFVNVRNGAIDYSVKLTNAEMDLFIESISKIRPIKINPTANWITN